MVSINNKNINPRVLILTAALIFALLSSSFPLTASALTDASAAPTELYIKNVQFLINNGVQFYNGANMAVPSHSAHITRAQYIRYIVQAMKFKLSAGSSVYSDADKHIYKNYITAAYENGLIPSSYFGKSFNPDYRITRFEAAFIAAKALKMDVYESVEPYYDDYKGAGVNALSDAYIVFGEYGTDGKYNYYPAKLATCGDAADILARIIKYAESPAEYKSEAVIEYANRVPVDSERRFFDLLWAMSSQRKKEIRVYMDLSYEQIEHTLQEFAVKKPEMNLMGFTVFTTENPKDALTLELSYITLPVTAEEELALTNAAVKKIVDTVIKDSMTEPGKLSAIYDYLIKNCVYDYEARDSKKFSGAYTAYNALIDKKAVCQGVAAAFNLLTNAAGIKSFSVNGTPPKSDEDHLWNAVYIGGEIYFCDPTWDINDKADSGKVIKYFMKTEQEMKELGYKFDTKKVTLEYFYK